MLSNTSRWSHARGNTVVPSRWQATIADSAQFSVLITQVADQRYVGSMLTLQMALGYTVTVPIVWLVPTLQANAGWGWAFVCVALGPAIGVLAIRSVLRQLKHHGEGQ